MATNLIFQGNRLPISLQNPLYEDSVDEDPLFSSGHLAYQDFFFDVENLSSSSQYSLSSLISESNEKIGRVFIVCLCSITTFMASTLAAITTVAAFGVAFVAINSTTPALITLCALAAFTLLAATIAYTLIGVTATITGTLFLR